MSPLILQAWREVDDMLCDAIPDHAKRRAIAEKIASIQTAERFAVAEQLEGMERRIRIALIGAGEEATVHGDTKSENCPDCGGDGVIPGGIDHLMEPCGNIAHAPPESSDTPNGQDCPACGTWVYEDGGLERCPNENCRRRFTPKDWR